jgi:hypothetical protein
MKGREFVRKMTVCIEKQTIARNWKGYLFIKEYGRNTFLVLQKIVMRREIKFKIKKTEIKF